MRQDVNEISYQGPKLFFEPQFPFPFCYPLEAGTGEKFFPLTVFFLRDFMVKIFPIFFINWYYVAAWIAWINQDVNLKNQAQAAVGHTL